MIREWQGLGYNRRALNLHRAACAIVAAHGWPDDLTELPGVGPYTAAAIRNQAFGEAVLPVDTNVRRIQERTGHAFGPEALQALFDLGATVCLARVPRCERCPLAGECPSRGTALRAAAQAVALRGVVPPAPGGAAAPRRRRSRGRSPSSTRRPSTSLVRDGLVASRPASSSALPA